MPIIEQQQKTDEARRKGILVVEDLEYRIRILEEKLNHIYNMCEDFNTNGYTIQDIINESKL
jgi:hypothetical protein